MRGCGLKFFQSYIEVGETYVTLSARVWIEIETKVMLNDYIVSHPQCEGVD